MTTEHVLYIPTIFFLGFLIGKLSTPLDQTNRSLISIDAKKRLIPRNIVLVSFFLFATVFVATHFLELPASAKAVIRSLGGRELFDKKPSFSSEAVYARISNFSQSGLQLYKRFTHTIDIVFPLTMFIFLLLLSRFVTQQLVNHRLLIRVLYIIPILWFTSDMVENAVIYYLLDDFPVKHDLLAGTLGFITITKFSFLLLSLAGPAVATLLRKRVVNLL